MGTEKRARQKANRQARLAQQEAETTKETRERSVRRIGKFVALGAAIVAVIVIFSVLRGGDDDTNTITFDEPSTSDDVEAETEAEVPEVELLESVPDDFVPFAGEGVLAATVPQARNDIYDEAPPMTIDPGGAYAALIRTDVGVIRVELFADEAPMTVNNFVNLARDGFYDGLVFHRVLEDFMAQAGDPTGTGSGGPGYAFADEVETGRTFDDRGLLAMANSGPDSNGSQFFITFSDTPHLNGLHTIFGEVVREEGVLDDIVRTGEGPPTVIESVVIVEG